MAGVTVCIARLDRHAAPDTNFVLVVIPHDGLGALGALKGNCKLAKG
jgi:hypothetical protein